MREGAGVKPFLQHKVSPRQSSMSVRFFDSKGSTASPASAAPQHLAAEPAELCLRACQHLSPKHSALSPSATVL